MNSNIVVERLTGGSLSTQKPNIVNPIEISKSVKSDVPILFFMMSGFMSIVNIFKILLFVNRNVCLGGISDFVTGNDFQICDGQAF